MEVAANEEILQVAQAAWVATEFERCLALEVLEVEERLEEARVHRDLGPPVMENHLEEADLVAKGKEVSLH